MIKELIKLANHLDSRGFAKEADYLDGIIKSADVEHEGQVTSIEFNEDTNTIEIEGHLSDEGRNFTHADCDARMAREHIYKIREYAHKLYNMLHDDDHLPSWVESKFAVMADGIGKIKHHLEYKVVKMEESEEQQK